MRTENYFQKISAGSALKEHQDDLCDSDKLPTVITRRKSFTS